jgi:hypothetical protein
LRGGRPAPMGSAIQREEMNLYRRYGLDNLRFTANELSIF